MKSEGVKDIVKWLEQECKSAKQELERAQIERKGCHYYMWEWYEQDIKVAQAKLDELVRVKISTEKYMKKLRHQGL